MSDKHTLVEDFAEYILRYNFEDASAAVDSYAETLLEEFCPELELSDKEIKALTESYKKLIEDNLVEDADALVQEWNQAAEEDEEARMEGLRSAYGQC